MLFDGIWYTPESQVCHTPKEKRPETLRESGRYIWWAGVLVIGGVGG